MSLVGLPRDVTQGHRPILIDALFAGEVAAIAHRFGVQVSSGYRSPQANAEAGGAGNSDHLRGDAVDFVGSPDAMRKLYAWATHAGFPYVEPMNQSANHVHISFKRPGGAAAAPGSGATAIPPANASGCLGWFLLVVALPELLGIAYAIHEWFA